VTDETWKAMTRKNLKGGQLLNQTRKRPMSNHFNSKKSDHFWIEMKQSIEHMLIYKNVLQKKSMTEKYLFLV
jgi:hypothetical protein